MRRAQTQYGFSLIELMLALVLGLILTAGAMYLFASNKQTYRTGDAVARLQQNGRYLLDTVARDLRMAGHLGCARPGNWDDAEVNVLASGLGSLDYPANAVEAVDSDGDGAPDTLTIRYASADAASLVADMTGTNAAVTLDDASGPDLGIEPNDLVLIADCTGADLFEATGVSQDGSGRTVLAHAGLSRAYNAEQAEVMRFVTHRYQVDATGATNGAGDPIRALYRNGDELLEGVEHMAVQFGECLNGSNRRYEDWSEAPGSLARVASVRIGFLLHSEQRVLESADRNTYAVAGTDIGPASAGGSPSHAEDPRMRRVFATTVSLRNRPQDGC